MPGRPGGRCATTSVIPRRASRWLSVTNVRAAVASMPCTRLRAERSAGRGEARGTPWGWMGVAS
jgi:hypothetical protein